MKAKKKVTPLEARLILLAAKNLRENPVMARKLVSRVSVETPAPITTPTLAPTTTEVVSVFRKLWTRLVGMFK
jgi:hypothetical protein